MKTDELTREKLGRISYLQAGTGIPILFLHGFPGSSHSWETAASAILRRSPGKYRAIIPDLLGFGESDSGGDDWHMDGQAHAIANLLKGLDISDLCLAAHDFGGPVALTLLRLHPEIQVRKLIISATNLFTDTPIPLPLRSAGVPILGDLVFGTVAGSPVGFRIMYQFATKNKESASWPAFRRHMTPQNMSSTARIFQHSLADLPGNYRMIEQTASQTKIPTLLLWGDRDPFFPISVAKRSEKIIPSSTLRIYERTGHFVPEERPTDVAHDLLDFLDQRTPTLTR